MSTTYNKSNSSSSSNGGSTSTTKTHSYTAAVGPVNSLTLENFNKYAQEYQEGEKVTNAYNQLQNQLNNAPGQFQSQYESMLNAAYDKIMNREDFSYNMNNDVLYQQYKDQYKTQGKAAMEDTMAQAAALTGGYGSSYSQTAGQQQYQNYLNALNDKLPELYQLSYQKYKDEGQELKDQYDITADRYNTEYGQYRDEVADYQTDRNYFYNQYSDERNFDYNKYNDNRNYWANEYWNERNAVHETDSESTTSGVTWNFTNTSSNSTTTSPDKVAGDDSGAKKITAKQPKNLDVIMDDLRMIQTGGYNNLKGNEAIEDYLLDQVEKKVLTQEEAAWILINRYGYQQ